MLSSTFLLLAFGSLVVASPTLDKRAITCLRVGATATARWTNRAGQSCTFTGVVGSNFGANPSGSGDYSCNGRCGAGCSGFALGNVYTQDCFSHDVCSYFNSASGGARYAGSFLQRKSQLTTASDPNCGAAFNAAVDDTAGGLGAGCSQTNPRNAVAKPSTQPVCR
ncbi:hypothetical protein HJFPF1_07502 [Paramyrothecium foliicola]|nr:hypothetical protein HJFPF1_07502 [Paramyrothecium foliicola]